MRLDDLATACRGGIHGQQFQPGNGPLSKVDEWRAKAAKHGTHLINIPTRRCIREAVLRYVFRYVLQG